MNKSNVDRLVEEIRLRHDRERVKENLRAVYKARPKYIFLTETGAIPTGELLKEAMKIMLPKRDVPLFYRMDPRRLMQYFDDWEPLLYQPEWALKDMTKEVNIANAEKTKMEEYLRKRIKDTSAPIVIYDDEIATGVSMYQLEKLLLRPSAGGLGEEFKCSNVERINSIASGGMSYPIAKITEKCNIPGSFGGGSPNIPFTQGDRIRFTGSIKRGKSEIKLKNGEFLNVSSKEIATAYKQFGREVGQELHEELERQKSLEQKVTSVIATLGLGAGIFFLQSNLTGNAISNFSNNTNSFIGIGSLAMGLIAGFFWLRKK